MTSELRNRSYQLYNSPYDEAIELSDFSSDDSAELAPLLNRSVEVLDRDKINQDYCDIDGEFSKLKSSYNKSYYLSLAFFVSLPVVYGVEIAIGGPVPGLVVGSAVNYAIARKISPNYPKLLENSKFLEEKVYLLHEKIHQLHESLETRDGLLEEDHKVKADAAVLSNSIYEMRKHLEDKVNPDTTQTNEDFQRSEYEYYRSEYYIAEMNR